MVQIQFKTHIHTHQLINYHVGMHDKHKIKQLMVSSHVYSTRLKSYTHDMIPRCGNNQLHSSHILKSAKEPIHVMVCLCLISFMRRTVGVTLKTLCPRGGWQQQEHVVKKSSFARRNIVPILPWIDSCHSRLIYLVILESSHPYPWSIVEENGC